MIIVSFSSIKLIVSFALVSKQSVAEYSCCLQYLMQPNVIADVEGIIRKALTFERTDIRRSTAKLDAQVLGDSMIQSGNHTLTSPGGNLMRNPLMETGKNSWTLTASQSSRESEMTVRFLFIRIVRTRDVFFKDSPGREYFQRLQESMQIQRSCANFIHHFIGIRSIYSLLSRCWFSFLEKLRRALRKNSVPNDDSITRTLDGLDQV